MVKTRWYTLYMYVFMVVFFLEASRRDNSALVIKNVLIY